MKKVAIDTLWPSHLVCQPFAGITIGEICGHVYQVKFLSICNVFSECPPPIQGNLNIHLIRLYHEYPDASMKMKNPAAETAGYLNVMSVNLMSSGQYAVTARQFVCTHRDLYPAIITINQQDKNRALLLQLQGKDS